METKSILGLLIAAAIPFVMFALWCEYFRKDLEAESEESALGEDEEETATERLTRIRLAGLMATVMQLVVFLSTSPIRQESPAMSITGLVATLAALVGQRWLQLRLEQESLPRPTVREAAPAPQLFPSGLFWAFLGMFLYFGILSGCVLTSAIAVAVLRVEGAAALVVIGLGAIAGFSLALASNFAISPWLFKRMLPSEEVRDPRVMALLSQWFRDSEVAAPEFRTFHPGTVRSANAWVTGFPRARGAIRPVLWLTPRLLEEVSRGNFDTEFEAIIKHEAAHMRLGHLARRFALAWLMSMLVLAAMAGSLALNAYFQSKQVASILPAFSLAMAMALFFGAFRAVQRQARSQELEADRFCVKTLGASARGLIGALRRIETLNAPIDGPTSGAGAGAFGSHPASADRIAALEPLAEAEDASARENSQEKRAA